MNKWLLSVIVTFAGQTLVAADPTRPDYQQSTQVAVKQLQLTMVRMTKDKPSATINGRLLHVGDTIAGYRVAKITAKQVLLANNKGHVRLNLITKGALKKSL
jgi:hypothetical protein